MILYQWALCWMRYHSLYYSKGVVYQPVKAKESPGSCCVFFLFLCLSINRGQLCSQVGQGVDPTQKNLTIPPRISVFCSQTDAWSLMLLQEKRWECKALQMHRPSSCWLRALWCAVCDQHKHAGKFSKCTCKIELQYGDTRSPTLKEVSKHGLASIFECRHWNQRSDTEDNYLHLTGTKHTMVLVTGYSLISFWAMLGICSPSSQELYLLRSFGDETLHKHIKF